jgi:hypothetical protein
LTEAQKTVATQTARSIRNMRDIIAYQRTQQAEAVRRGMFDQADRIGSYIEFLEGQIEKLRLVMDKLYGL